MNMDEYERKSEMELRTRVLQTLDEKRKELLDETIWYKELCKQADDMPVCRPDVYTFNTLTIDQRIINLKYWAVTNEKERIENKYVNTGR